MRVRRMLWVLSASLLPWAAGCGGGKCNSFGIYSLWIGLALSFGLTFGLAAVWAMLLKRRFGLPEFAPVYFGQVGLGVLGIGVVMVALGGGCPDETMWAPSIGAVVAQLVWTGARALWLGRRASEPET